MDPCVSARTAALLNASLPEVHPLFPLSEQNIPPADEETINRIDTVLASLPADPFCWSERTRRKTATIAAGLLRFRNVNCSYYVPRHKLSITLPRNMKIIADSRTNAILFLEAKGPDSRTGVTKVGRKVYHVLVSNQSIACLFSLSPIGEKNSESRKMNYAQFCKERNTEKAIQKRIVSGYPHRLFDYEYFAKQEGGVRKRLSICERYEDDLLTMYNSIPLARFPLRMFGLMLRIAECVKSFHDVNFILRDIKPENFVVSHERVHTPRDFYDTSWKVAFCDFGFVLDQNQREGAQITWCGSPPYCSPELLRDALKTGSGGTKGSNLVNLYPENEPFDLVSSDLRPTDIYALGILFYVIVHQANFPWSEPKNIVDQFEKQLKLPTEARHSVIAFDPKRPDIQASLRPIILSMLTVSISERATIDEVLQKMRMLEQQVNS